MQRVNLLEFLISIESKKTNFGYFATDINIDALENFELPDLVKDEIPTLNRFGYMKIRLDEFCDDFINYSVTSNNPCLELGTAYGFIANQAIKNGGKIIANDVSYEHLTILLKSAPKEYLENLSIMPGRFPNEIEFENGSISAILSSRLFHFLDASEIERGLDKVHDWLEDDGIFYFISVTPYHDNIRGEFEPIYTERQEAGDKWPGRVKSQWDIHPSTAQYVPEFLHVFEPVQLEKLFPKHGFEILKMKLFDFEGDTDSKGMGHVGIKARKINARNE